MAAFAPLIGTHLGAKKVAIRYSINGKSRSAEIVGILQMAVEPLPTMHPSGETFTALLGERPMPCDYAMSRRLRSGSRSARKGSRDRNGSKAWRLAA
jgi:hypothetical protein